MLNKKKEPPPEGPEVRRITDQLNNELSEQVLEEVFILSGRYIKTAPEGLSDFSPRLPARITSVRCKGKFIYFQTDGDWNIWNTLGMTGGWSRQYGEYTRVLFKFNTTRAFFTDMRNFGTLKFMQGQKALEKKLRSLGPDMLVEDLPDQSFHLLVKRAGVKTLPEFLMNQKNISGVGNYIKAEALYLAKLSPHRKCYTLSEEESATLNQAIKAVIRASYETGGSTFRTYSDFNGDVGTFSDRFMVYRQTKDPQGNLVIKQDTKDKRVTHWVPEVQK